MKEKLEDSIKQKEHQLAKAICFYKDAVKEAKSYPLELYILKTHCDEIEKELNYYNAMLKFYDADVD